MAVVLSDEIVSRDKTIARQTEIILSLNLKIRDQAKKIVALESVEPTVVEKLVNTYEKPVNQRNDDFEQGKRIGEMAVRRIMEERTSTKLAEEFVLAWKNYSAGNISWHDFKQVEDKVIVK